MSGIITEISGGVLRVMDAALLGLLAWVAVRVLVVGAVAVGLFACCLFGGKRLNGGA
jgi:hypothetical protein